MGDRECERCNWNVETPSPRLLFPRSLNDEAGALDPAFCSSPCFWLLQDPVRLSLRLLAAMSGVEPWEHRVSRQVIHSSASTTAQGVLYLPTISSGASLCSRLHAEISAHFPWRIANDWEEDMAVHTATSLWLCRSCSWNRPRPAPELTWS